MNIQLALAITLYSFEHCGGSVRDVDPWALRVDFEICNFKKGNLVK